MVLIRRSGGAWHQPESSRYDNERELQELVKRTPTLLPGGNALAVVAEFSIPSIGSADLVGVSAGGDITIVECKLNSNPEIRREVVGQTLAYAGGLWRMGYDEFASTFAARSGMPLLASLQAATGADIEEGELREAVRRRLAAGEFRLIIAVDAITPELRLIIEYLNEHTLPTVTVLALELSFARDGDLELLIPTVYGEEAADRKTRAASGGSAWNSATFAEEVQARTIARGQGVLFGPAPLPAVNETWLLLHHAGPFSVSVELSLPSGMESSGLVSGWKERILLPEQLIGGLPMAGSDNLAPAAPPAVDVNVRRRAG